MNYKQLQDKQKELDDFIIESKNLYNLHSDHLLSNMYNAARDELNEIKEDVTNAEEWIDLAHFVLSIANKHDIHLINHVGIYETNLLECLRLTEVSLDKALRYSKCFKHWSNKKPNSDDILAIQMHLEGMLEYISRACVILGTDLVVEYNKKYEENVNRQKRGY